MVNSTKTYYTLCLTIDLLCVQFFLDILRYVNNISEIWYSLKNLRICEETTQVTKN